MRPLWCCLLLCVCACAQKNIGDWCAVKSGHTGICRPIAECLVAVVQVRHGKIPEICTFQGTVAIVCCVENQNVNQIHENFGPVDTNISLAVSLRPNEKPSTFINQPKDTSQITTFNDDNQDTGNQRPGGNEKIDPYAPKEKLSANPRISQIKCQEYSERVQQVITALPLLPNSDPISITVQNCDYSKLPLIVGGEKTIPGEFPHMAALGYRGDGGTTEWLCGGSLISDYYVLTAAHCALSLKRPYIVRLGELNLNRTDDGASPKDYRIVDIILHPGYKPPSKYNDIALLKLERRVSFNKFIRPACLYTKDTFSVNKTVATGWGRIEYAENPSDILLKVALDIIENPLCDSLYRSSKTSTLSHGITFSMMCAGDLTGHKDTCNGDSGGPIQITSNDNQCIYYVVGVTSFGKFCASKNSPGVYSRVSYFVPWIESVVWGNN